MPPFPVSRVYETNLPIALMPSAETGQLTLPANGESFSFVMSRADFERLGRQIARLLSEIVPPAHKGERNPPSNGK